MAAYVVLFRESPVRDPAEMEAYRSAPRGDTGGMRPLVVYGKQEVIEGEGPDAVIILEFPTFEEARNWYHSPEYQAAAAHRLKAADYRGVIVEGWDPPARPA